MRLILAAMINMIKKKNVLIGLSVLSSVMLVGCNNPSNVSKEVVNESMNVISSIEDVEFVPVVKLKTESESLPSKIKNYNKLNLITRRESGEHAMSIELISDTAKDISLRKAEQMKSLLGDNAELIPIGEVIEINQKDEELENYFLKGYESSRDGEEQKSILLTLQDKYPIMGIYFDAQSKDLTKSLKMMLSMEDKISLMLNNLLEKDEAEEVLRFVKEEISRANEEQEQGFVPIYTADNKPQYWKSSSISINDSLELEILFLHDEETYSVRCELISHIR